MSLDKEETEFKGQSYSLEPMNLLLPKIMQ